VRTADPSADGRRFAVIFATVELPSAAGAYRQWCIGGYTRVYGVYQPAEFLTAYTHLSDHK